MNNQAAADPVTDEFRSDESAPSSVSTTGKLQARALGTADIVFMVVAAAAPMAVTVGMMPMAFALGNGPGVTLSWLLAVGAMLLFAIGYVRIVPFVRNAGAFYAYISASIGRTWGLGAAYVAALCYLALACSTLGGFAFFSEQLFEQFTGRHLHWSLWAVLGIALTGWLCYRRITLAATVLGVALVSEVILLFVLDVRILYGVTPRAVDLHLFSPQWLLAPGLGITAIYAFNSMIGIEGTAIYQEEARDRIVTVRRATYISLTVIGIFYVFTAWCLTMAVGSENVAAVAGASPNTFVMDRAVAYLGSTGGTATGLLVLTSMFAAVLGLSNNSARYLFALARDGVLPSILARTHSTHRSPHIAGLVISGSMLAVVGVSVAMGLHPLYTVQNALAGLGSAGLMALLGTTAILIPVFFIRQRKITLATTVAPAIGGIVIWIATIIAFMNFSALTGVESSVINRLPLLLIVLCAIGFLQALWIRAKYPHRYALIGATRVDP